MSFGRATSSSKSTRMRAFVLESQLTSQVQGGRAPVRLSHASSSRSGTPCRGISWKSQACAVGHRAEPTQRQRSSNSRVAETAIAAAAAAAAAAASRSASSTRAGLGHAAGRPTKRPEPPSGEAQNHGLLSDASSLLHVGAASHSNSSLGDLASTSSARLQLLHDELEDANHRFSRVRESQANAIVPLIAAAEAARTVRAMASPLAGLPPPGVPAERCFSIADSDEVRPGASCLAPAGPLPPWPLSPTSRLTQNTGAPEFEKGHDTSFPSLPFEEGHYGTRQPCAQRPRSPRDTRQAHAQSPHSPAGLSSGQEASSPGSGISDCSTALHLNLRMENDALREALGECVRKLSALEGERELFLEEGVFDLVNSLCKRRIASNASSAPTLPASGTDAWTSGSEDEATD
eukprot:TRINITY_DN3005_c0_g1_i1.p1 TRINITY_DN3005_c0_g1~~TRINITY_DN3005_c0_g1_i1.p1  ORF type:complete len:415 (-),score=38.92 TRINITY_DN3005_c0_g1_i1:365-1579(-)